MVLVVERGIGELVESLRSGDINAVVALVGFLAAWGLVLRVLILRRRRGY